MKQLYLASVLAIFMSPLLSLGNDLDVARMPPAKTAAQNLVSSDVVNEVSDAVAERKERSLAGQPPAIATESVRMAVLAGVGVSPEIADLLSVHLADQKAVELFERDRLAEIVAEQELDAMQTDGVLKLGVIAGVKGLILLRTNLSAAKPRLSARLVAIGSGIVVGQLDVPLPVEDPDAWTQLAAGRFASMAHKLKVKQGAAVPVSVVGVSSPFTSDEAFMLESRLRSMLTERLFSVPQIFVTERREMGSLVREKSFLGADEEAFWNGAYLIDGQLNRDGDGLDVLTLDLRLVPPKGGAFLVVRDSGPKADLRDLIDRLVVKVATTVGQPGSAGSGDRLAEADRYLEEADWHLRWSQFDDARISVAAARALGNESASQWRVYLRALEGLTRQSPDSLVSVNLPRYSFRLAERPQAGQLKLAREALLCFSSGVAEPELAADEQFHEFGFRLLVNVSGLLRQFAHAREERVRHAAALASLRRRCRETAVLWRGNRRSADFNLDSRRAPRVPGLPPIENMPQLEGWLGKFWTDNPEDSADWLTHHVLADHFDSNRLALFNTYRPFLVCWSFQDEKRHDAVWEGVLKKWAGSSNLVLRLESVGRQLWPLRWPENEGIDDLKRRFVDLAWRLRTNIYEGEVPGGYWETATNGLLNCYRKNIPVSGLHEFVAKFEGGREEHFREAKTLARLKAREERKGKLDAARRYLTTASADESGQFGHRMPRLDWTERESISLMEPMKSFGDRYNWPGDSLSVYHAVLRRTDPENAPKMLAVTNVASGIVQVLVSQRGGLSRKSAGFTGALSPAKLAEITARLFDGPPSERRRPSPRMTPIPGAARMAQNHEMVAGRPIHIDGFFDVPLEKCPPRFGDVYAWQHKQIMYADGSMWMLGLLVVRDRPPPRADGTVPPKNRPMLVGIRSDNLEASFYELPDVIVRNRQLRVDGSWNMSVAAGPDVVVLAHGGKLFARARSEEGDGWETMQVQSRPGGRLWGAGGKVFYIDSNTVHVLEGVGKRFRLLAGNRRRPAQNPMDSLAVYHVAAVDDDGAGGILIADRGAGVFSVDRDFKQWRQHPGMTGWELQNVGDRIVAARPGVTRGWDAKKAAFVDLYNNPGQSYDQGGAFEQYAVPIGGGKLVRLKGRIKYKKRGDRIVIEGNATASGELLVPWDRSNWTPAK